MSEFSESSTSWHESKAQGLLKTKGEGLQPRGTETETVCLFIVLFIYQWQSSL